MRNMEINRTYHRPISIVVETVRKMPDVRELAQETQITANLKLDRERALQMKKEIDDQLAHGDFVTIEITGSS